MKVQFKTAVLITGILLFTANASRAEDQKWISDKDQAIKILDKDCVQAFNILWPWAKKGNQESIYALLFYTAMGDIYWPTGRDNASRRKEMTILTAYSSGYKTSEKEEDFRKSMYLMSDYDHLGGRDFLKCLKETPSKNCVSLAVKKGVIPSFEEFAKQTDDLISIGYKVTCSKNSSD